MGWDGQGGVAHLLYAVAESGGVCVRGEHVQTGKKNLTVILWGEKTSKNELPVQELIVPKSLLKRPAFLDSFTFGCGRNR